MGSRDKNVLTLLLIMVIVIIVGLIGYLGFEIVNGKVKESQSEEITDEFDSQIPTVTEDELVVDENIVTTPNEENTGSSTNSGGTSTSSSYSGSSYSSSGVNISGYWVVGTIRIPATGIKYSIFSEPTRQALERGVGQVYTTGGLNQPGNTVISGHNYRNRLFFSKNKNLKIGDTVIIKDTSGLEITYVIYDKFTTDSNDASFFQRNTDGKREITLTTCTDDGTKTGQRLIILAREQ